MKLSKAQQKKIIRIIYQLEQRGDELSCEAAFYLMEMALKSEGGIGL